MFTSDHPDFKRLWSSADDETATEWFRWVDAFGGGLFPESRTRDEGPAQAVVLLYIIAWSMRERTNVLVFDAHEKRLAELLERWAVPQGGEASPRCPFWRLQHHRFWRVMSWAQYCQTRAGAHLSATQHSPDTLVGVLDPGAWAAVIGDTDLRNNLLTWLTGNQWPETFIQVLADLGLRTHQSPEPTGPAGEPIPSMCAVSGPPPESQVPLASLTRHQLYTTGELGAHLNIRVEPGVSAMHTLSADTSALFISDASWSLKPASASESGERIEWVISNREYEHWGVLYGLNDAEQIRVFTQAGDSKSYCYHGVYKRESVARRRWSIRRQIHKVALEWVED